MKLYAIYNKKEERYEDCYVALGTCKQAMHGWRFSGGNGRPSKKYEIHELDTPSPNAIYTVKDFIDTDRYEKWVWDKRLLTFGQEPVSSDTKDL